MKINKNNRNTKSKKIILIILSIILIIMIALAGYKIYDKYLSNNGKKHDIQTVEKQTIELENYDYYLHGNATEYEKRLADDLKKVLSKEEVNFDEYAKVISQLFISDLFTLDNKNGSSDITSIQYVYDDYQATFKEIVKDTIYASIEVDLDGTRQQTLPSVTAVEIASITNNKFSYNGKVLDENAYYVKTNITYEADLGYPTAYEVVLVKNNDLLQVVKASKV